MKDALHPQRFATPGPLLIAAIGVAIGGIWVASIAASVKWTVAGILGVLALMPALLVRPARLYGVGLYLLLLELEPRGKSLDKYFVDAGSYLGRYGLPPSADVSIQILPSDVVLLVLAIAWLVRRGTSPTAGSPISPQALVLAAFLGWATIGVLVRAEVMFFAVGELVRQFKFALVFAWAANGLDSRRMFQGVVVLLLGCIVVQAAVTLSSFVFQSTGHPLSFLLDLGAGGYSSDFSNRTFISEEAEFEGMRALGSFGNPVQTAIYLELLLPMAFAFAWVQRRASLRWACALVFALGAAALVTTFSRAALLGLGCGIGMSTLLVYRRGYLAKTQTVILGYAAVVALTAASPLLYDYATTRPEMVEKRIPLMEKAALMIVRRPLLGVGLNNHTAAKREMFVADEPSEEKLPTHDHYLALGSEVGLVGLGLHLAFLVLVLRQAWKLTSSKDRLVQGFAIAVVGAACGLYVHLLADNFSGNAQRSMFFFYAGAIVALTRLETFAEDAGLQEIP